jgi:hypothetical protein
MHNNIAEPADIPQLAAALRYSSAGWPVFPCEPGAKTPATAHGFKDATTDPAVIRSWWRNTPYNVAIATGVPGPDVLDVDNKDGGSGWAALNRLKAAGLVSGARCVVRTRSGGLHLYFAGTSQRNTAGIGGAALDFRGQGGYVLAAPSMVGGSAYKVIAHRAPTGAAFQLGAARRLLDPPKSPAVRRATVKARGLGGLARWVAAQPEGKRNAALFWAACRAIEGGHDDLEPLAQAAEQSGLSADEVRRTIESAKRRVR